MTRGSERSCTCGRGVKGEPCPLCREPAIPAYWCEVCDRVVPAKRCPLCGLKARKIRE